MEMGFDHTTWPSGQEHEAPAGFDWHGLRARFLAAQACRSALAAGEEATASGGSFDAAAAAALARHEGGTPGINPNGLADRKAERREDGTTPGHTDPTFEGNDD